MQVGEITKINVAFSNRGKNEQVSLKDKTQYFGIIIM